MATNKITKHPGGRPSKLSDLVVSNLDSILKIGGTIEEACSYAGINKTTYYRWLKNDESFATKMDAAQHYPDIIAKNVVVDSIIKDRNLDSAKWWLEKREYRTQNQVLQQFNVGGEMTLDFIGKDEK